MFLAILKVVNSSVMECNICHQKFRKRSDGKLAKRNLVNRLVRCFVRNVRAHTFSTQRF